MASAEEERPAPVVIAALLLFLQGIWGLLVAIRFVRAAQIGAPGDSVTTALLFSGLTVVVSILSISSGAGLLRLRRRARVGGIIVTIAHFLLLELSDRMISGGFGGRIDLPTISSFLFTTSIVTLLVLSRRSYMAIVSARAKEAGEGGRGFQQKISNTHQS
jgi:hypothetical protein